MAEEAITKCPHFDTPTFIAVMPSPLDEFPCPHSTRPTPRKKIAGLESFSRVKTSKPCQTLEEKGTMGRDGKGRNEDATTNSFSRIKTPQKNDLRDHALLGDTGAGECEPQGRGENLEDRVVFARHHGPQLRD